MCNVFICSFLASTVSSQLLLCLFFVTAFDVVIVVMVQSFWIGLTVGCFIIYGLFMLVCLTSFWRISTSEKNVVSKKPLLQEGLMNHLSLLTVTQSLQQPSSKV